MLEPAVALHPDDPGPALQLGKLYLAAGRLREGEAVLGEVARLLPRDPEPYRLLARAYLRQGRHVAARSEIRRALERAPQDRRSRAVAERIERVAGEAGASP